MRHLLKWLPGMEDLQPDIEHLLDRAEVISRQLGAWIGSIKDSGFQGARSQNTQTREMNQRVKRQEECLDRLKALVNETARRNVSPGDGKTNPG